MSGALLAAPKEEREGDYGTLEKWHKRRDQSGQNAEGDLASRVRSLLMGDHDRWEEDGHASFVQSGRTPRGPTQRRPTNRDGLSTNADVIPRNLVLYLERLLRDSVLGGHGGERGEASRLIDIDVE